MNVVAFPSTSKPSHLVITHHGREEMADKDAIGCLVDVSSLLEREFPRKMQICDFPDSEHPVFTVVTIPRADLQSAAYEKAATAAIDYIVKLLQSKHYTDIRNLP